MFLETQLDLALSSPRSQIRFMREFLGNFGRLNLIAKEVHSRADLEKFLDHCRADQDVQALHIVSHGMESRHESCIVLTEDELVDLRDRNNRNLFADLGVEAIFLSCCQLGKDARTMQRLQEVSRAVAVFSYARDVDDYQAFLTESLFYHLAYGYIHGRRSDLSMQSVYEKLKFSLDYLGIDRSPSSLTEPMLGAVFSQGV
jgi:hypothetical protein